MWRLKLEQKTEDTIANILEILVIIAALVTLPLTAAYWFEWEHPGFIIADWVVWSVFIVEYGFYMAISDDRRQTTRNMWLSVFIIVFSFPLLHEILKSTRLIRLVRPVPLLRQSMVLRQIQLMRFSNMRSKGTQKGWEKTKEHLGEDHEVTRWMDYLERLKAWAVQRVMSVFRRGSSPDSSASDES
jgi:hypothetical protein